MKTIWESYTPREKLVLLALKTRQTNTIRTVLKRQSKELSKLEDKLVSELVEYFTRLERIVLTTYTKSTEEGIPLHNIQTLINICFQDWHKEYTDKVNHYHQLVKF